MQTWHICTVHKAVRKNFSAVFHEWWISLTLLSATSTRAAFSKIKLNLFKDFLPEFMCISPIFPVAAAFKYVSMLRAAKNKINLLHMYL